MGVLSNIADFRSFIKGHWKLLALVILILFLPIVVKTYFLIRIGIVIGLYAINITGMTLLTRYAGLVSLGHAAFFALGAYLSAIFTVRLGLNAWVSMATAAGITVFFAYLFSIPFLKLRRAYLAMATLGLGEVAFLLAKDLTEITGGVTGIPGIPHLKLGRIVLSEDWQIFYLISCFLVFFVFITENIGKTRLGRAYHAIRTNETAAKAMGINVQWELNRLFCFSALVSALTGSIMAHFITFISPESFTLDFSFALVIIVVIGGANIWGGLATAIVLTGLSEILRGLQDFSLGFYGLILIVSLFFFPEGVAVLFKKSYAHQKISNHGPKPKTLDMKDSINFESYPEDFKSKRGEILETKNISMNFGGTQALVKVSASVDYSQIMGIIGPNGAGKTTFLNTINGFLNPSEGRIIFQGHDITHKLPHEIAQSGVSRTFQLINLFKGMKVIENVMVGCHIKTNSGMLVSGLNLSRSRCEESMMLNTAMRTLELLGLAERAYDVVEKLPYGEQKLVELARALAMEPKLLLLDEPASGLNPKETKRLLDILFRIRDRGITLVLVEHNMPLVMSASDSVLVLDFGRVITEGTPAEVSKDEKVIKAYLGKEM